MFKTLMILSPLLLFLTLSDAAQEQAAKPAPSAEYTIPVEAAHRTNPIKPNAESIARGKKLYGYDCAMCHGKDGYGKGDVAEDMKLKISDFSNPAALKDRTDGELFYIIKNGKGQMPPEGDRVKPEALWDLVNYIRSFARKTASEDKAEAPQKPD